MKSKLKPIWLGYFLIIGLAIFYTWATWRFFTLPLPGGNDFAAHYTAWEAFFKEGYSPYSDQAAIYTQQAIRGRPALAGEDQNRLTYPFYSLLVHAPFILVDYALARAIYMTLLQAALLCGVVWTMDFLNWRTPFWLLAVILAWSLLYYPHARGVILGQFAIFGFFSSIGALVLLKRGHDTAAGFLLVLSTVKPTLIFLMVPFLLLWGLIHRRWYFVLSFLGLLGLLLIGSFLVLPSWFGEWLERIWTYSEYTVGQSPVWLLTHQAIPALGLVGEWVISLLFLLGMFVAWGWAFRSKDGYNFFWVFSITLLVSNLIVPRSATTNYVMMLPALLWIFACLDRSFRRGRWILLILLLVSVIGLWWLHLATVVGNQEQPIMFIPPPLFIGLTLIAGYRWLARDARRFEVALGRQG